MIKELIKVAAKLDKLGLRREADAIDLLIKKYSGDIDETKIKYSLDNDEHMAVAEHLVSSIKELRGDLNLFSLIRSSLDNEAEERYGETVYHTHSWTDSILRSMSEKTGIGWEMSGKPELISGSGYFKMNPKNQWDENIEPPLESISASYNSEKRTLTISTVELF